MNSKKKIREFVLLEKSTPRKGNDQEPIQSNSTSCPKHQMGKGQVQLRATTGITKNKEFIDLRKIICLRKFVPLTFQN